MGETSELSELDRDRIFIRRGPFQTPEDDRVSNLPVPAVIAEEGQTDYFSCYLSYISNVGCAPPMPDVRSKRKRLSKWAMFIMMTIIAGLQSLFHIKWRLLRVNTKLKYILFAGYVLNKALLKVTFIYVVCFRREKLKKLIIRLRNSGSVFRSCFNKKKVKIACSVILVTIVGKVIAQEILHEDRVVDWDLKDAVLQRSFEMGHFLYAWKSEKHNQSEVEVERIDDLYGQDVNPTTIWFASTQLTMVIVGKSFEKVINIMLSASLTLYCLTYSLKEELAQERKIDNVRQPTFPTIVWLMYKEIKEISEEMNDIFGEYFYLVHVNNFLFGSLCLYQITHGDLDVESIIFLSIEITLLSVTYFLQAKASGTNLVLRNWSQRNYSHVVSVWLESENRSLVISTLIHELQTSPMGLTINNTPMDSAFIAQFIGVIMSNYVLLVGATNDAN